MIIDLSEVVDCDCRGATRSIPLAVFLSEGGHDH
jgi:hypothetical protein